MKVFNEDIEETTLEKIVCDKCGKESIAGVSEDCDTCPEVPGMLTLRVKAWAGDGDDIGAEIDVCNACFEGHILSNFEGISWNTVDEMIEGTTPITEEMIAARQTVFEEEQRLTEIEMQLSPSERIEPDDADWADQ